MARRRKSNDAAGGVLLLLMIAVAIAIFLVKILITLLLFATAPALTIGWFTTWRPNGAPAIGNPDRFDDNIAWREITELLVKRKNLLNQLRKQYELGFANGLDVTAKSDCRLFHAGSKLGKQLNHNIELGYSELRLIVIAIEEIRMDILSKIPDWRPPVDHWLNLKRLNFAITISIMTLLASYLLFYYAIPPDVAEFASRALLWNPDPDVITGRLVFACGVTGVVFIAVWQLKEERGWEKVEHETFSKWRSLEAKWGFEIEGEHFDASSDQEDNNYYSKTDETQPNPESEAWHEILNVDKTASPEEIKQAYKQAIKQYHPDRVSGLGERIQKVAEQESKRINAAFAEAKRMRGFS